jgi:GTP-binding protein
MTEAIVSIVGRPNVGKSTFFNRLIGRRQAIVDDQPGVTRDRNYANAEWCGQKFLLVDTGGFLPLPKEIIDRAVREQVQIAIEESDLILLLVDVRTGITTTDEDLARILRDSDKNVILVVNKVDDERHEPEVGQFYKLGLGTPEPVSAMVGRGTGDLLDKVVAIISKTQPVEEYRDAIKLAVIGKENVGKSSLVNTFLNKNRQIVTPVPGTTRDSVDSGFKYRGQKYVIIDTAGLKKKAKIKENILFYSNLRTHRSIKRSDVIIYMISADEGLSKQDVQVLVEAARERKGILCVFNKWDLVEKDEKTMNSIKKDVQERFGDLRYIPTLFVSVLQKQRLLKILDIATNIYHDRLRRIPTRELNDFFLPLIKQTTPPATRGKEIKINYVTQIKTGPPLFVFYSNYPDLIPLSYRRFLENRLRRHYGFSGVPLTISFRKK